MVFANFGQKISGDELTFNICAPNMHITSLNERKLKRLKIRLRTNQLQNRLRERAYKFFPLSKEAQVQFNL